MSGDYTQRTSKALAGKWDVMVGYIMVMNKKEIVKIRSTTKKKYIEIIYHRLSKIVQG